MSEEPKPRACEAHFVRDTNALVVVDQFGKKMEDYSGDYHENIDKLRKDFPGINPDI